MIDLDDDKIVFVLPGGDRKPVTSEWSDAENPVTLTREMNGAWIYFGSFEKNGSWYVDFISLKGFSKLSRWALNASGDYIGQEHIGISSIGPLRPRFPYRCVNSAANVAELAKRYSNDLQIYLASKYLFGDVSFARDFMNSYAPAESGFTKAPEEPSRPRIQASFIFNHNYARKLQTLEDAYSHKFSKVRYVLPNICPDSDKCYAFPAGSYSYQNLIYYMIDQVIREDGLDEEAWYLFAHDDVYLNSKFSEHTFENYIEDAERSSALFNLDVFNTRWARNSKWSWTERILDRILSQKDTRFGNGFEGLDAFFDIDALSKGVSDIFFVKGKYIQLFKEILGNYISQDIFAEVAIASSLKVLAQMSDTSVGQFKGRYLWRQDRKLVDESYIEDFNGSSDLFLHPVKTSLMARR